LSACPQKSLKITVVIHSAGTAAAEGGIAVRVFSLDTSFRWILAAGVSFRGANDLKF
jgi:hypothetical protein